MAFFGKKKPDSDESTSDGGEGINADPKKAARFFEYARTTHEASNYEYAVTLWLQGLRQDPTSMSGLESFYESCEAFIAKRGKFGPTKEQLKNFDGKGQVERLLVALLNWGLKPLDVGAGIKVIESLQKIEDLDMGEQIYWVGEKTLLAARREKKPRKDNFVKLKDLFVKAGAFDLAVKAGEFAVEVDPADSELQAEVRNLSAQATMSSGGYEQTGQEGGFRANIRNYEAQRQLEEEGRLVKTDEVVERSVASAKEDYESRPEDTAAIQKYARALLQRGAPADEKAAHELLMKAYEDTGEFRFRQQAGEIKIRQGKRKIAKLAEQAEANPDDAVAQEMLRKGRKALLTLEAQEYQLRVKAYPTELSLKFELGKRLFELGKLEESIQLFQQARNDPKRRSACLNYLGRAFLKLGWRDEAIDTLRTAIEAHEMPDDDVGKDLRYGLMSALEDKARETSDLDAAEEAAKIASSIAMQQINFRDIRERRGALQELVKELRAGATS